MKKILFVFFVLWLFASQSYAWSPALQAVVGMMGAATGYNCMTGTYTLAWNGQWPSDTDKACATSADTTGVNGTITGSPDIGTDYGEGAPIVGIKANAVNEYISYTNSSYVGFNGAYTVWVRMYVSEAPTGDTKIFDLNYDSNHYVTCVVKSTRDIMCTWRDGTTVTATAYGDVAITAGAWTDLAYSWDQPNQNHSVNADGTWDDDNNELTSTQSNEITAIRIGTVANFSMNATQYLSVDKWAIVSGYKASKPSGW